MRRFLSSVIILGVSFTAAAVFAAETAGRQELRFVPHEELIKKSEPSPTMDLPSGDQVAQWMNFSRPVKLEVATLAGSKGRGDYRKWGKLIQFNTYQAPQDSLITYGIGVYEKGTLWTDRRQEMIKGVEKAVRDAAKEPQRFDEEWKKTYRIEDRPDGRKVYFAMLGMGPGGGVLGAFTFLPQYDLLVLEMQDSQDDVPDEKRIKDPAKPENDLSILILKTEDHIHANK